MEKQAVNPFLPIDVYIPDGEAHVFGDRVYLFGSHDKECGDTYCMLPYEIFSASIDDLSTWTSKGINYSAKQDPLSKDGRVYLYAPDCVKGNDNRYYLYYCLSGYKGKGGYDGPISVAVADTPDGKYEFYGHVKNKDGSLMKRFVPFDPAVINDNGTIRLYYGTWYPFDELPFFASPIMKNIEAGMFNKSIDEIKNEKEGVMGAVCCVLEDDMLTIKEEAKHIIPSKTKGTPFESKVYPFKKGGHSLYGHGFFEGSSIRKIKDTYYFVYSSVNGHELCYATSKYPDKEFTYRGVIVSNGDVGYQGRKEKERANHTGTNHGCIENINGQWYVFYHRETNGSDYSRQACAEKIIIKDDGSIPQTELTSCGLNDGPLKAEGEFPATVCCNLTNNKMPHGGNKSFKNLPMITFDGKDRYLKNLRKRSVARYKYFDFSEADSISLTIRGDAIIKVSIDDELIGKISISSSSWEEKTLPLCSSKKKAVLSFEIEKGNADILSFVFK